jgi:hypothetical protein
MEYGDVHLAWCFGFLKAFLRRLRIFGYDFILFGDSGKRVDGEPSGGFCR